MSRLQVLHRRFAEYDEFEHVVREWDLDFRQLDAGPSTAELLQIVCGPVMITDTRLNRRYDQRGSTPPGTRTFAVLEHGVPEIFWYGQPVTDAYLMSFNSSGDFRALSHPGFKAFTVSVSEQHLAETAQVLGLPEPGNLIGTDERALRISTSVLRPLRYLLGQVCQRATTPAAAVDSDLLADTIGNELTRLLLSALDSRVATTQMRERQRDRAVHRVLEFMEAHPQRTVTVRQLCEISNVSERTLEYGFRERFGLSPKQYEKIRRINGVRKELRNTDPDHFRVSDIAARWGFHHSGQFAADYRRLFRELPLQTFSKSNNIAQ